MTKIRESRYLDREKHPIDISTTSDFVLLSKTYGKQFEDKAEDLS